MKFKAARIHFFSDVFLAVAFVGAKAPYTSYCRWTTFKSSICWRDSYEGVGEFAEIPIKDWFFSKQKAIIALFICNNADLDWLNKTLPFTYCE